MELEIVVNGQPAAVVASEDDTLGEVIPVVLVASSNTIRPPEDWQLRDTEGMMLDLDTKMKDAPSGCLYVNLKAGVQA